MKTTLKTKTTPPKKDNPKREAVPKNKDNPRNEEWWELVRDWEKVLREHEDRIEQGQKILNENLEKKRNKRKVGNFTT